MKTRSERIAATLRDRILRDELPAGTHLQEIPLSEAMGVSRTPVRSALQAIAAEGLLDYLPKRGYTVRDFSLAEIETAHEVRANLEGMACRLAAERGLSHEREAELGDILGRGDRILAKGRLDEADRQPWIEMNDAFHSLILDCAGNRMLTGLVEQTHRVPLGSRRAIHWYDFQAVRGSHQLHHRIFGYIRDRKAVNAEALMREHILQAVEQIRGRTAARAETHPPSKPGRRRVRRPLPTEEEPMLVKQLHHVAYRCNDAQETAKFYTDVLGLKYTMAYSADHVPSTGEDSPHFHLFFEMEDGSCVAFFEVPESPEMEFDPNTPSWVQHLALRVDSMDDLLAAKKRLEDHGLEVLGPTDHGMCQSIYFHDPSGHRLELTCSTLTPEMHKTLSESAEAMLEQWSKTKRAVPNPLQAAGY